MYTPWYFCIFVTYIYYHIWTSTDQPLQQVNCGLFTWYCFMQLVRNIFIQLVLWHIFMYINWKLNATLDALHIMTPVEGFLIYLQWSSGAVISICPNLWDKTQNDFAPFKQVSGILQVCCASKILEKNQADWGDVFSSSLYTTKVWVVVQAVRRI